MGAGYLEVMQTFASIRGLDADTQYRRVGLEPDGACEAAREVTASMLRVLIAGDECIAIGLTAMFMQGLAIGARMAQAGILEHDQAIA